MTLAPRIEGELPIRSSGWQFIAAFRRRVTEGLLSGRPHPRSNYQVVEDEPGFLRVRAVSYWTALNVGLNDVELRLSSSGSVRFRVRYWRWASYVVGLSGTLGLIGVALLMTDARGYVDRHSSTLLPGVSAEQNVILAWVLVVFWGFLWPWVLIAMHKRPLRGLVERLVRDVDAAAANR